MWHIWVERSESVLLATDYILGISFLGASQHTANISCRCHKSSPGMHHVHEELDRHMNQLHNSCCATVRDVVKTRRAKQYLPQQACRTPEHDQHLRAALPAPVP